jgi:uncharacterized lipoprotein YbaY
MAAPLTNRVHGQAFIKGEPAEFHGNEILYISVRDSLRHDAECIELGSTTIPLRRGQHMPIGFQCAFDPNKAHMKFEQIRSIPGGITLSASIERQEKLLYINDTNIPLAEEVDIELVAVE